MNVAEAFRQEGIKAMGVSGETPKRELAEILARYERGEIDVLVNAQLLAEGWNSPRATICMHLAPTASKRIYQQRVGRVTRRHPGKESGIVVDFVHPATRHDDPVVTLHSLLDREVYRGGAIVVGPVRRGRGRRVRVERRVLPVCADEDRRIEVFERELWRIAVEFLDYGEQVQWAALAGARVAPSGWRRARAMLHFDKSGELKRSFLLTAVERNKNSQLRLRALQEIAQSRDADAFERAVDVVRTWSREERREGVKILLQALAERRIGRRDQASHWIWDLADMTREVHEEYAVQRWPETKRLLGLLVNSSGGAHARNARRLVHAARKQDRRLSAAILAAAVAHTPEAMEVVRGARTRMARKPSALSRELLRNFPKRKTRGRRRRKKGDDVGVPQLTGAVAAGEGAVVEVGVDGAVLEPTGANGNGTGTGGGGEAGQGQGEGEGRSRSKRRSRSRRKANAKARAAAEAAAAGGGEQAETGEAEAAEVQAGGGNGREPATTPVAAATPAPVDEAAAARAIEAAAASLLHPGRPGRRSGRGRGRATPVEPVTPPEPTEAPEPVEAAQAPEPAEGTPTPEPVEAAQAPEPAEVPEDAPKPKRRRTPVRKPVAEEPVPADAEEAPATVEAAEEAPKPKRRRTPVKPAAEEPAATEVADAVQSEPEAEKPKRRRAPAKKKVVEAPTAEEAVATVEAAEAPEAAEEAPKPKRRRAPAKKKVAEEPPAEEAVAAEVAEEAPKPKRRAPARKKAAAEPEPEAATAPADDEDGAEKPKPRRRRAPVRAAAAEPEQLSLDAAGDAPAEEAPKPKRRRATRAKATDEPSDPPPPEQLDDAA
jgi:hypothetical protein